MPMLRYAEMPKLRYAVLAACLLAFLSLQAQNDSLPRKNHTFQVGIGHTNILDTYLSQEQFSGLGFTLLARVEREKPGSRWTTFLEHEANFSKAKDRAGQQSELQGDYTFFYGRLYRWRFPHNWTIQAGGMLTANAGFIYNTGNGNNPAQGRLSAQLMPTATVSRDLQLFHRHCRLRYELQLPLLGLMFSPNYGQSYYEIFNRGNYDHNIVPTTFVSAPTFRQQFGVEYAVTPYTALTLSFLGYYQQSHVNNLKTHIYTHRFMIGFVRHFSIIKHRL